MADTDEGMEKRVAKPSTKVAEEMTGRAPPADEAIASDVAGLCRRS
jgi:hypothetical protein